MRSSSCQEALDGEWRRVDTPVWIPSWSAVASSTKNPTKPFA